MELIGDTPESWPVESSTDLHRDDWVVAFRSDQVLSPHDPEAPSFRRLVVEHPGACVAMAIDGDDQVLCLRQYRHPAQMRFLELPAGVIDDPGEDPQEVAARELREEAELEAARWTHLISVWASPGVSAERHHLYLAEGLSAASRGDFALHHEEADMETLWVPYADLLEGVLAGRIQDAPVALAVLTLNARRQRGQ
ncbi:NUDIX domain-containing protein [Nocardioides daejeonensis]|uniref:NUDIX domain-containing protein n=1 Tax=Nocardioides daejeonensis TaxID=1046556 RepID=UPI000D749166|nr:NUDIX hydrolase [Nocardioides daejeonensis]